MHQKTMSRKVNALVSVICTFALAFSLGVPYLAFATDEEESSPLAMEVTDTPAAAEDEAVITDEPAVVEDAVQATEPAEDETAQDEATTPDPQPTPEAPAADDATNEAAPADTATPAATDTVTYTFVGAQGGTVTRDVAKGTVIATDQIPTAPAAAYTMYGQNIPGTFVGWSMNKYSSGTASVEMDFCTDAYNTDWSAFNPINQPAKVDRTFYPVYKINAYTVRIGMSTVEALSMGEVGIYMFAAPGSAITKDNPLVKFMETEAPYPEGGASRILGWFYENDNGEFGDSVSFPVTVTSDMTLENGKSLVCVYAFPEENTDSSQFTSIQVNGDERVKVSGDLTGPNIPEGATVEVDALPVTTGPAYDDLDKAMGQSRIGDVFEITLLVNGQEVHDGFGTLAISLPIDAAYNGHTIIVYHRHQDGSITTTRATAKNGLVTFSVTDLSWFAMEDGGVPGGAPAKVGGLAQTGDEVPMMALIALISVAGGVACFSLMNAHSRRKGLHAR